MTRLVTLTEADEPEFEDSDFEDFYDEDGNSSPGGLFDAGGHPIGERWADFADAIRDRMKYED